MWFELLEDSGRAMDGGNEILGYRKVRFSKIVERVGDVNRW